MAATIHLGGYHSIGDALLALLAFLEESGRRPAGPVREVYLRFSAEKHLDLPAAYLTPSPAEYVTEVQIPTAPSAAISRTSHSD